jgi:glycosyltransferase involved in cell wall biosynthesis
LGLDITSQIAPEAIVTLHWIARFAAFSELLRTLGPTRKLVWRLADMNPFTGGCHYDDGCGRYTSCCGECPMLALSGPRDLSNAVWRRKASALDQLADNQLHVVAISRAWAEQASMSSLLGRFPISVIPPSVDVDVFRPLDRTLCRRTIGLESDGRVLLVVASSLDDPVKGVDLLSEALTGIADQQHLTLLTVGNGSIPSLRQGARHIHLGYLSDESMIATAYNCADVVVLPSRQEAFGQVVIEALACGVPVVGFGTGGVRDSVVDGVNGFVAGEVTASGLGHALNRALADPHALDAMRRACRSTAVERFAVGVVASRYVDLYRSLCDGAPGGGQSPSPCA